MRSNYRILGDYIQEVNVRNYELNTNTLLGININKYYMPSVANIVGTDMSVYKIVKQNQFACNRMHVGRDKRLPVALSRTDDDFIVSPAYDVFEIIDTEVLLPEYLMMWFTRKEFDRNAWYYTDADVRGGLPWKSFLDMELPVPSITKQKEIVKEYKVLVDRINLNNQLIQKLEETAQAIYKQWFVDFEFPFDFVQGKPDKNGQPYKSSGGEMVFNEELEKEVPKGWEVNVISKLIAVKDGTHDSPEPNNEGFPLVTSTHLKLYDLALNETYKISSEDFHQINMRSKVDKHDILFSMIGTVGLISYVLYNEINFAIKNVGLFKTSERKEIAGFILFFLKSDYLKNYLLESPLGGVQNYVTLSFLRNIPIVVPSNEILLKFEGYSDKIIEQIYFKVKENNLMDSMRSLLLSKLATIEN